jgi:hypothetical protein
MGFIKGRAYPIILAMAKDGNEQAKKLLDGVDSMSQDEVDGMISEVLGSKTKTTEEKATLEKTVVPVMPRKLTKEQQAELDSENKPQSFTDIAKGKGEQEKATLEKTVVPIMPRRLTEEQQKETVSQKTIWNDMVKQITDKNPQLANDRLGMIQAIEDRYGIGTNAAGELVDGMGIGKNTSYPDDGFDQYAQKDREADPLTGTGKQMDTLFKETGGDINSDQALKIAIDYGISVNEVYKNAEVWKQDNQEQLQAKQAIPSLKKDTVKAKVDNVAKQVKRQDGTYKLENGKPQKVDLNKGFSASFFRPEITDQEAEQIEKIIGNQLGSQYVGVFDGEGELSYNVDQQTADLMANIFNQKSTWNNEIQDVVPNPNYDENKKVDYAKAIEELKNALANKKLKGV